MSELPAQLAIFALPGATLLPGTHLQLNIFEPRYLNLVFDALADSRMFGMVQPVQTASSVEVNIEGERLQPTLHKVGCAGRIVSFSETGDGRLFITLRGICRFRLGEELGLQRGYRRVLVDWSQFATDIQPDVASVPQFAELKIALQSYVAAKGIHVDWDGLEKMSPVGAIQFLSMNLPLSNDEKQALLEVSDVAARWSALWAIVQMSMNESDKTRH